VILSTDRVSTLLVDGHVFSINNFISTDDYFENVSKVISRILSKSQSV
jgi:hypothetical protein